VVFFLVVATFAMWGSPSGIAAFFVKLPCCSLVLTVYLFPVTFAEYFMICGYWAFALSMPSVFCSVATRSFAGLYQAMVIAEVMATGHFLGACDERVIASKW